jgi:hypothetical protein
MRTSVTFFSVAPTSRNAALIRSGYLRGGLVCAPSGTSAQIVPGTQSAVSFVAEIVAVPLRLSVILTR